MTVHRKVDAWVTLTVRKYPAALGTVSYRFSIEGQPFADGAAYLGADLAAAQARILADGGFGDIARAVSSLDGQIEQSTLELTIYDFDGVIRGLLDDPTTNRIDAGRWEARVEYASHEGRLAEVGPAVAMRGLVTEATPTPGRQARLTIRDLFGAHLKGFDLDAPLPIPKLGEDFGDLDEFPEALRDKVANLNLGENSDHGTVDAAGNNAEKGLVPPDYVGKTLISDGFPGTPPTSPTYLQPPQNLTYTVHGTPGTKTVSVGVTALTHFGETTMSNIVTITTYPSNPNGTDNVEFNWDPPDDDADQIIAYVLYIRDGGGTPKYYLEEMNNGATYVNPEVTYTDDGDDSHFKGYRHGPPTVNTAQVAPGDAGVPGSGPMYWHTFITNYGVCPFTDGEVDFYGANLEETGGTAKRVLLDASTANSGIRNDEIIAPGDALWPHANPWITRNGRRYSGFYMRGARADAHVNGQVGMAVNLPGYRENPDGTGALVDQADQVWQLVLSNFGGLDPDTPRYEDQPTWLGVPLWADGTPKLKTSACETFRTTGAARMGTVKGPLFRKVITKPTTIREFHAWVCWSTPGGRIAGNHHGQVFPVYMPHGAAPSGQHFIDRINVRQLGEMTIDRNTVTEVTFIYDRDAELDNWRRKEQTLPDATALAANDNRPKTRDRIEMELTGDPLTALVSAYYWLAIFTAQLRRQPLTVGWLGLASDLAQACQLTHYDGLGSTGDQARPLWLERLVTSFGREEIALTGLDLSTLDIPTIPGVTTAGAFADGLTLGAFADGAVLGGYPS